MYYVFGTDQLPQINSNASPLEIQNWKKHPSVSKCYDKLYRQVNVENTNTYMSRIINKVFCNKKNEAKVKIAFAMSICESYLNPENPYIQITEKHIRPKINKNLVSFKLIMLKYF